MFDNPLARKEQQQQRTKVPFKTQNPSSLEMQIFIISNTNFVVSNFVVVKVLMDSPVTVSNKDLFLV